jgi:hypothetical protein
LAGVLPDMKSDTKNYVKLQSIYRQQALKDLETFKKIMDGTEESTEEESREKEVGKEDEKDKDEAKVKEEEEEEEEEDEEEDEEDEEDEEEYCTDMGHYTEGPDLDVSSEMLETFVKNSAHIRLIQGEKYETPPKDWGECSD